MSNQRASRTSPSWSPTTKLVVALTFIVMLGALLVRFRSIIGPVLLALILAYLLHPLAAMLSRATRLSWRASVNIIFFLLSVILIALFTLTGLALAQQLQSLIRLVQRFVFDIPQLAAELSTQVYTLGPFQLDMSQFDVTTISEQLLSVIQPILGRVGGLVGSFATSAVVILGRIVFTLLIAYFVLADAARGVPEVLLDIELPGYQEDLRRLGIQLGRIWNAYLRGQLILFSLTVISFAVLLTVLGVRFVLGLSLLAGLARFVPYAGPLAVWIITAVVTIFQEGNYFGLNPMQYMLLVLILEIILDQVFDNMITPRLMGQTLGVHPAAVLVAAIVATNLIGIPGLLLAAPVLATLKLFGRYAFRKMLEQDPWSDFPENPESVEVIWLRSLRDRWRRLRIWRRRGADDV